MDKDTIIELKKSIDAIKIATSKIVRVFNRISNNDFRKLRTI